MAKNRFDDLFEDADQAFNNDESFKEKLASFKGLTEEEISAIVPDTTSRDIYNKIAKLVDKATATNMTQAELITNIKTLGQTAINIAKKIPGLASLF